MFGERKGKSRRARFEIHKASRIRKRAEKLSTSELTQWAEATSMNMNYWISRYITHPGDGVCIDEALAHNDSLCAILLEIQARRAIGVA